MTRGRSLVTRLAVVQAALAAALVLAFAALAIWLSSRTLARQERAYLDESVTLVADALRREWGEEGTLPKAAAETIQEAAPPGVHFEIFDREGRLIAQTGADPASAGRGGVRETRVAIQRGATLVARISTRPRADSTRALFLALGLAAVPVLLTAVVLSRSLARRLLRPLVRMTAQAERAAPGGSGTRLGHPEDPSEIASLSAAFNRLLDRTDALIRVEQRFTQDASHELRTPLALVQGEIEYALADASLPQRQREALARARDHAREVTDLVEALLVLNRSEPDAVRGSDGDLPLNLGDVAREVAAEFRAREHGRAADLSLDAEDEVLIPGQAALIGGAVRNLVSNAMKFTSPGQPIRVSVASAGGRAALVVEDGGPGIPEDDRERIFAPFVRGAEARAEREGFGLGLPILRRIVEAHGGDVTVESSSLGGARFVVHLPLWRTPA